MAGRVVLVVDFYGGPLLPAFMFPLKGKEWNDSLQFDLIWHVISRIAVW